MPSRTARLSKKGCGFATPECRAQRDVAVHPRPAPPPPLLAAPRLSTTALGDLEIRWVVSFRHVGELLRRDLVQQRSVWRAVLPHAIANGLAARALEDTPFDLIDQQLVTGGTERLARSFSRRLSFLHEHPKAVAIVERWLAPGGLLGDVAAFNDLGRAMFENIGPVLPEAALAALERAGNGDPQVAAT